MRNTFRHTLYGFMIFWLSFSARSFSYNESLGTITTSNDSIVIRSDDFGCNEGGV